MRNCHTFCYFFSNVIRIKRHVTDHKLFSENKIMLSHSSVTSFIHVAVFFFLPNLSLLVPPYLFSLPFMAHNIIINQSKPFLVTWVFMNKNSSSNSFHISTACIYAKSLLICTSLALPKCEVKNLLICTSNSNCFYTFVPWMFCNFHFIREFCEIP